VEVPLSRNVHASHSRSSPRTLIWLHQPSFPNLTPPRRLNDQSIHQSADPKRSTSKHGNSTTNAPAVASLSMTSLKWSLADLNTIPQNDIKVFSTFSCGGGSSLGYKLAGATVLGGCDLDPQMMWHYQQNLHPKHFFQCPISDLLTADLPEELYHLSVLDGSPPCSTYSTAGQREKAWGKLKHFREGQQKQVLSDLFFDYLALVQRLKPKVAIAENVSGLIKGRAKGYVKLICDQFKAIGYTPQVFLIDAADCGVPQHRERVFIIAHRNDIQVPRLTLAPDAEWISAAAACSDLQTLTPAEVLETKPAPNTIKWWPDTTPGKDFGDTRVRLGHKDSLFNHIRLDGTKPSNTITSCARSTLSHWSECRKLSLREMSRLSTFPEDYTFKSTNLGAYLLGMSVPPFLMRYVASEVIKQWLLWTPPESEPSLKHG
jgi:DNA (cytosine-5)-methyltransferase 1